MVIDRIEAYPRLGTEAAPGTGYLTVLLVALLWQAGTGLAQAEPPAGSQPVRQAYPAAAQTAPQSVRTPLPGYGKTESPAPAEAEAVPER